MLPEESFALNRSTSRGRQWCCRPCDAQRDAVYRATLHGALNVLLNDAKKHSAERGSKGRLEAGECTITIDQLHLLYEAQHGFCYWFPIKKMSLVSGTSWKMSLERLDTSQGYTLANCVLCCLEFQGKRTWTWHKIQRMMVLRWASFGMDRFLAAVYDEGEKRRCRHPNPERYKSGECKECKREYDAAKRRGEIKPQLRVRCDHGDETERNNSGHCKLCLQEADAQRNRTPRRFLQKMLAHMKSSSKKRCHPPPEHTFDVLVELARHQTGRCDVSRLPLGFSADCDFQASPERVCAEDSYTIDNVLFVCLEFNSTCNQTEKQQEVGEDSQWTRDKFDEWAAWFDSDAGRAHVASHCAVPL
jgi:hypothetical protein